MGGQGWEGRNRRAGGGSGRVGVEGCGHEGAGRGEEDYWWRGCEDGGVEGGGQAYFHSTTRLHRGLAQGGTQPLQHHMHFDFPHTMHSDNVRFYTRHPN